MSPRSRVVDRTIIDLSIGPKTLSISPTGFPFPWINQAFCLCWLRRNRSNSLHRCERWKAPCGIPTVFSFFPSSSSSLFNRLTTRFLSLSSRFAHLFAESFRGFYMFNVLVAPLYLLFRSRWKLCEILSFFHFSDNICNYSYSSFFAIFFFFSLSLSYVQFTRTNLLIRKKGSLSETLKLSNDLV